MDKKALQLKISTKIESLREEIKELRIIAKPIAPENSIGRISRMDAINNKSINDRMLRKAEEKLKKLEIALSKINEEDFGKVSKEEIGKQREIAVRSMDLNGDEKVSAEELMQQHAKRAEFSVKRMIKKLDSNGDGSLSFVELKKSQRVGNLSRMFDRLDKDDDGYISKDEVVRVKKNMINLLTR